MSLNAREALYAELTTNTSYLRNEFLKLGKPKLILQNMDFIQDVQDNLDRVLDREGGNEMMRNLLTEVKKANKLEAFVNALRKVKQDQLVELLENRYQELEKEFHNLNQISEGSRSSMVPVDDLVSRSQNLKK